MVAIKLKDSQLFDEISDQRCIEQANSGLRSGCTYRLEDMYINPYSDDPCEATRGDIQAERKVKDYTHMHTNTHTPPPPPPPPLASVNSAYVYTHTHTHIQAHILCMHAVIHVVSTWSTMHPQTQEDHDKETYYNAEILKLKEYHKYDNVQGKQCIKLFCILHAAGKCMYPQFLQPLPDMHTVYAWSVSLIFLHTELLVP